MIGIYKITNKLNGKAYIGQSIDIKRRWQEHKNEKNSSNSLYQDFKIFGIENFNFEILEICNEEELNNKEKYWINYFNTYNDGYNLTCGGQGSCKGNKIIVRIKEENNENVFKIRWEDYTAAARNLSPSALNLYMYLAKNQDNYEFYFSSKDYCQTFDVVDKTFRNARNELLKKGYLKEGENNHVYFDSRGSYGETKESLNKRLLELGETLKVQDEKRYNKVYEELKKAKLKDIKDENLYMIKVKEIIGFAEDMLKEISVNEFKNLI